MEALVSVIVPVYKVEKYIARCVDALINQTLQNIEIILVDDGSPDECPVICDNYEKKDTRIRVIHKENEGLGYARNSGISIAKGKYIAFVDSDDYVSKEFLEELYVLAESNDADACIGGNTSVMKQGIIQYPHEYAGTVFSKKEIVEKLLPTMLGYKYDGTGYSGMSVWRGIYRRDVIDKNEIKFPSERQYISEDVVFDLLLYPKMEKVVISNTVSYFYCYNGASLTKTYNPKRFEKYIELYKYELELIKILQNERDLSERVTSMLLANVRVVIMQEVAHDLTGARKRIKKMLENTTVQNAISDYPINRMKLSHKLFCIAIKYKWCTGICLMAYLHNIRKGI